MACSCPRRRTAVTFDTLRAVGDKIEAFGFNREGKESIGEWDAEDLEMAEGFGVPYGSRTRVAAVKEKEPVVSNRKVASIFLTSATRKTGDQY